MVKVSNDQMIRKWCNTVTWQALYVTCASACNTCIIIAKQRMTLTFRVIHQVTFTILIIVLYDFCLFQIGKTKMIPVATNKATLTQNFWRLP